MDSIIGKEIKDTKLEKPFRLIIAGPSGAGKTTFLRELVNNCHFDSPFETIYYHYPDYLDEIPVQFDQIVDYRQGLLNVNEFSSVPKNSLIIYDDLMNECGKSEDTMKLFTVMARKRNVSLIYLVQNIFDNSTHFRNIRLNASGVVMFNFSASTDITKRVIGQFGLHSSLPRRLIDQIYANPYAYIYVDLRTGRHKSFDAVRGNIFAENFSVYNKMEYIAVSKSDFLKNFKIIEAKEGSVRAVKNAIAIRDNKRKSSKRKSRKANAKKRKQSQDTRNRATNDDDGATAASYDGASTTATRPKCCIYANRSNESADKSAS